MRILLDTTVLIDLLRKRNKRREFLTTLVEAHHTPATTVLNIAELYAGMRSGEETVTERLLSGLVCLGISERTARLGGALKNTWSKRGKTLGLADTLIAAVAIEEQCALLTDNRKDFPMPEVQLYPLP
ncbi:MAG: type II toxin-antitoxin system VapC family toxin [Candidatus Acidiferrum sp.]